MATGRESVKIKLVSTVCVVVGLGGIFCFFGVGPFVESLGLVVLGLSSLVPLDYDALTAGVDWVTVWMPADEITSFISTSFGCVVGG